MTNIKYIYFFIFVSVLLFQVSFSQYFSYDKYLSCGVQNPNKANDCLKHSLDSGFACCYITEIPEEPTSRCGLVAYYARKSVIEPAYKGPPYFDCGESGYYLKVSIAFILVLFLL
jgi:hypothetical protein